MDQKPSKGRIVMYVGQHQQVYAAIVTNVNDEKGTEDTVNLTIFQDGAPFFAQRVPHSDSAGHVPNTWHWPPRV